jgi:NADH-quinone oxidoreductase subunit H
MAISLFDILTALFNILVFPGLIFMGIFGLAAEYLDRKFHAILQNRMGPPWYQPLADIIKLVAKQTSVPEHADKTVFALMPIVALTSIVTSLMYIPMWGPRSLFAFKGDIIVVLYLLTIPTFTFFLGGWYSRSVFSMIGAARTIMQLFAYEIPLLLSVLAPALLADTWSLSEMTVFYAQHPLLGLCNVVAFAISLVALLGKLEKVPFDIPEAETEIVGGTFTEYSGRMLATFRIALDIEMVVGASLIAAVFLPYGLGFGPVIGFALYVVKVLFIVGLLCIARTIFARLRIDQMINFCWKFVAPVAFAQIVANLIIKGIHAQ